MADEIKISQLKQQGIIQGNKDVTAENRAKKTGKKDEPVSIHQTEKVDEHSADETSLPVVQNPEQTENSPMSVQEAQSLADIDAMADIPDDTQDIINVFNIDNSTDDGKKIIERLKGLNPKQLEEVNPKILKILFELYDLPCDFEFFSRVLEITNDITLKNKEEKKSEQEQIAKNFGRQNFLHKQFMSKIGSVESMQEVVKTLIEFENRNEIEAIKNVRDTISTQEKAKALKEAVQRGFDGTTSYDLQYGFDTKKAQSQIGSFEYTQMLDEIIANNSHLSKKELNKLFKDISGMDIETYLEQKKNGSFSFDTAQISETSERSAKVSYYANKATYGEKQLKELQDALIREKGKTLAEVKDSFQEIIDNEGMISDLTNALISLVGTSRGDVESSINIEDKNIQELKECIKNNDVIGFAIKYREITGVNPDIDNYNKMNAAKQTFQSVQVAHTMQEASIALRKELDRESYKPERNYNLDSCENYLRAKFPEYSPLEKALMKTYNNDKKMCLLWIAQKKHDLKLDNEPQWKVYSELVKEFHKEAKEFSSEVFKNKSFEEYTQEYQNAIKSVYGQNIPQEKLNDYIANQTIAKNLVQTGVMIGVGILSGGSALAAAIATGTMSVSEKMTSNKGLNLREDGGDIAITMATTYGGWKIFGMVAKSTATPLLKKLNDKSIQSLLEANGIKITTAARAISLTSAAAGGASSAVSTTVVEGMIAGQDASAILSNSLKSGSSGALFAIVFAGAAELKNALTSPVKRFKADYNSILQELAKHEEHADFLKSIKGIENTPEGATKVVEYLANMRKTTFFSAEDVELITQDEIPTKYADNNPKNQPGYHIEVEKAFEYKYDSPALYKGVKLTPQEKALWNAIFKFESSFKNLVKDYYSIPKYARDKNDFKFVMQPELPNGSRETQQPTSDITIQAKAETQVVKHQEFQAQPVHTEPIQSEQPVEHQTPDTLETKLKNGLARAFNFGNEIATDIAPILSASLDKLPAVPAALSELAGEKLVEGLAVSGTMKETVKDKAPKIPTKNKIVQPIKTISEEEFVQRILSYKNNLNYEYYIFECFAEDGKSIREDILQIIEKNFANGEFSEGRTKRLVMAYKKQPELVTQWVEKGLKDVGYTLEAYQKHPELTQKAIEAGIKDGWKIDDLVNSCEKNPELAIKCLDKGITTNFYIESILNAYEKAPEWVDKLLDYEFKSGTMIKDICKVAQENPKAVQACLDAGIKESYTIEGFVESYKTNPELTELYLKSGGKSNYYLESLLKLAETNPNEVKTALSCGYNSPWDIEHIVEQKYSADVLQKLKELNLPLHTDSRIIKGFAEHLDVIEKYMQLNPDEKDNKKNLSEAGRLTEKVTEQNKDKILEIMNYIMEKKYILVGKSMFLGSPTDIDSRPDIILSALKNENWKILLDKCIEKDIPRAYIPAILKSRTNLDLALDIIDNCKYKESIGSLIELGITDWREPVKIAEKYELEKVETGIPCVAFAYKNHNIDIDALLAKCKQLGMPNEQTAEVLVALSYNPNIFPIFETCLDLGISNHINRILRSAFEDISDAYKYINLFKKYGITNGDDILGTSASHNTKFLEYYFRHGLKTGKEIEKDKSIYAKEDFAKSIVEKINFSALGKNSSHGSWSNDFIVTILNLFEGLTPEEQATKIQTMQKTIETMKQRRDQLKSGLEDLPDLEIEKFVLNNFEEIEKTKKLMGDSGFIDAFGLKMDGLEDLIKDIDLLYDSLEPKNIEKVLETFAPAESQKGKRIAKIVKQLNARNSELAKIPELAKKKPVMDIYNARRKKLTAQIYEKQKLLKSMNSKDKIEKLRILAAMQKIAPKRIADFIKIINNRQALTRAVNEEIFHLLNVPFDVALSEKLGLDKSEYLTTIAMSSTDFQTNLKALIETVRNNPDMTIAEALDTLPQNIETRKAFERAGLNYDRWIHADKNSFETVQVTINGDKARAAAIKSLEKDFNDEAFKLIPKEEADKIYTALKNKGITLKEEKETLFDADGFTAGTKTSLKLKYDDEPITFEKIEDVISIIKEVMNNNEFWTISHPDAKINEAKNTLYNHMVKLRANELDIAKNAKGEKTTSLEIRQTDMTDLAHSLFLGNHGACCTAVGTGCNQFSAPTYIINRLISAIEVVDGKNFVGNSMIYIAEVDGVPSLMIDNIELSAKYQYNNGIKDAFFTYAQKLVAELGKPDMPIYAGPHRHKLNMPEETKKERKVKILGSTDNQEIYIDYIGHYTVDGEKVETAETYKLPQAKLPPKTQPEKFDVANAPVEGRRVITLEIVPETSPIEKLSPKDQAKILGFISVDNMSEKEIASLASVIHDEICERLGIPPQVRNEIKIEGSLLQKAAQDIQKGLNNEMVLLQIASALKLDTSERMAIMMGKLTFDVFDKKDDVSKMSKEEIFEKIYQAIGKTFNIEDIESLRNNENLKRVLNKPESFDNNLNTALGSHSSTENIIRLKANNANLFDTIAHETFHEYAIYLIRHLPKATVEEIFKKGLLDKVKAGENENISIPEILGKKMKMPEYLPEGFYDWAEKNLFNNPERLENLIMYCSSIQDYNEKVADLTRECKSMANQLFDIDDILSPEGNEFVTDNAYQAVVELAVKEKIQQSDVDKIEKMFKEISEKFTGEDKTKVDKILDTVMTEINEFVASTQKDMWSLADLRGSIDYAEMELGKDFVQKIDELLKRDLVKVRNVATSEKTINLLGKLFGDDIPNERECSKENLLKYIISLETRYESAISRYIEPLSDDCKMEMTPKLQKRALRYAHRVLEEDKGVRKLNGYEEYFGALEEIEARKNGHVAELNALRKFKKIIPSDSKVQKGIDKLIKLQLEKIDVENQLNLLIRQIANLRNENHQKEMMEDIQKMELLSDIDLNDEALFEKFLTGNGNKTEREAQEKELLKKIDEMKEKLVKTRNESKKLKISLSQEIQGLNL